MSTIKYTIAIFAILFYTVSAISAQGIVFDIAISGSDANLKVDSVAQSRTDSAFTLYSQSARTYVAKSISFSSSGTFDSNFDIVTNMTSSRSLSPISGAAYAENVGSSCNPLARNCSSCSSGLYSNVKDIDVSTAASTTSQLLTHAYALEAQNGFAKAGLNKHSENSSVSSVYAVRANVISIVGLVECARPPAAPAAESGKPALCPWGEQSIGSYPIFPHYNSSSS